MTGSGLEDQTDTTTDESSHTPASRSTVALEESAATEAVLPSYEVTDVAGGGSVRGIVRLSAPSALLPDIPVSKDQTACGEATANPSLEVGPGNAVVNAVVSLVGVMKGKPMAKLAKPAELDQRGCIYVPHLQIVPVGTTLEISNSDPILHNVHGYLGGSETLFNLAMPIQGFRIQRQLDRPGLVTLRCDAGHTWMSGYIVVQEHPYYAQTGSNGSFTLRDVPPGDYRLRLWHEFLGEKEVPLTVEADATASVELELTAPTPSSSES
jgi:plastocyanin